MIVELFGLPASGKTTTARKLESSFGFKIVKINNKLELFLYNLAFAFLHPVIFSYLFLKLVLNSELFRYKLINIFLYGNAKYQKAKKYKNAIIDQGLLQNLLSTPDDILMYSSMKEMASKLFLVDKVIIMDVSIEDSIERSKDRGYWARDRFGTEYLRRWQSCLAENYALARRALASSSEHVYLHTQTVGLDKELSPELIKFIQPSKRIIYITNVELPTVKARGVQIMKSCEAFARTGVQIELVIPWHVARIKEDPFSYYKVERNFEIKRLPSIDLFFIKVIPRKLAYYVRSLSFVASSWLYVIKHAGGGATFYSRDYAILLLLSIMGLKPIAEIHDYRSKRSKAFIGLILKNARRIIVNSEGTLELLRQHYKLNLDKVLVAPNGVDLDYFNIKLTKDEARRSLGIDSNDIIFGYVGSLEAVGNDKGVGDLIEAFNKISLSMARLLIVGGPDNLVNKYKSMVRSDNIEFAGHVEYGKIPTYLRAIDVVVIPLPNNAHGKTTSPIKVYEFMAAGKAIVASNIDTLKSALSESGAVFYEVGNVEDLRDTVLHLARDEELRHDLEANVLKNLKDISWDGRATKIINHIEHNEISK
ncbi:MAG: hypothetical protein A2568_03510 [Candidatus Yanofskybacteria bacterium RIFOXYD1_FULL_44_17]|uniref:Glycosyl transferase group 1 n=1 Tax=Candidatus Yanofskybacteria bacterium GW2011_GWE2_40_11 TaxID=1619033 RepID=A0A0G0QK45_9BACT|nr:MAG: Glycosyl transferase group 1 [Candidatus Yanofskybacteria bacterium GW2011_GWE1_40_10]KKR40734.1 MAG: Glycosyl transferase group 1 [Candidatus Yanofskybacteria bacterium GW2011_GWE2_40_11]OGN36017.1 MAG: hypothetical protein A2207_03090 [Candidatus Yanofskybacteria bacterium RIFOXYA1_FULL_44_17]OGN36381.1 MAG: hypothetical protein A2241_01395 [Candidatus Yanofskybacteria bacterium RIFOXYA2_FULL_45_28]OGN37440.1 MAG: hypothetical protein A2371_00540 [Candidatus Yanofskybacteria bacterium